MPDGTAEVFVDLAVLRLECSEDDGLASWPLELMGQSCRSLRTRGDGACAIHAAFGTGDATRQELRHEQPRGLLRGLLAHPLETIRGCVRPTHMALVDAVVSSLWTDFVVPYVGTDLPRPPNEKSMFLERLQASHLWEPVLEHIWVNRAL